jgi:hypothetical protein
MADGERLFFGMPLDETALDAIVMRLKTAFSALIRMR